MDDLLPGVPREQQVATSRRTNFIVRHWRGDYSLGVSYWVIGILPGAVLNAVLAEVGESSNFFRELGQRSAGLVMLGVGALLPAVRLWVLGGIWNSASRHTQRGGSATWASLAKVSVFLGVLGTATDFAAQGVPILTEGVRLTLGADNTPPYDIHLLRNGTEVELAGGMPFGTTDALAEILDAAPAVQVIHLNSHGGRMAEASKLYRMIKDRKLVTYTSTHCASACAFAFLAGRERYLGAGGRLGFHTVSIGGTLGGDVVPELNDYVRRDFKTNGVPDAFADRALSTPPGDMWYPTSDELVSANIVDAVVDPGRFGLSGIIEWRDAHKLEANLLNIPVFAALAEYDQRNYARIRTAFVDGIQHGQPMPDIISAVRSILVEELLPGYLMTAPDAALVRYWRAQVEEMKYLGKLNPRRCVDLVYPEYSKEKPDLRRLLRDDLQKEDLAAMAELVRGAAENPQKPGASPRSDADLKAALARVDKKYPMALEIVQNPDGHMDDPASLCSANVLVYSEILAIGDVRRSGAVLRSLMSPE